MADVFIGGELPADRTFRHAIVLDYMRLLQGLRSRSTGSTAPVDQALGPMGYAAVPPGPAMSKRSGKSESGYRVYRTEDVVRVEFLEAHVVGHTCVSQLQERLAQVIKRVPEAKVVLDLKQVQYISSAALGELLSAHKQLRARQGCMSMANVGPELLEILATTRLDAVFGIHADVPDAIRSFGRS